MMRMKMAFFPSKQEHMAFYLKKKKLEVHPMRVRYSHLKGLNPSMTDSLCSQKETFQFCSSEWFLHMILGICPRIERVITDHQVKNCAKALVFAHSLTFFFPLDVLAETCESDSSYFNMPLLSLIALIGATVGGLLARQRRGELKRLNEQLRQINAALRRQAKIESYAPKLSYAPVGRTPEAELLVDPKKEQLIAKLRTGKNFLRNQELEKAFVEFKAALDLAAALEDHLEEKKAARGLGASLQRQGKYKEAIKYHSKVVEIADRFGEDSGVTEAYGAIADCYTELGDLEKAGKFYDKYIARLEKD